MSKKQIVICGSMSFYQQMSEVCSILQENNIPAILPADDDQMLLKLTSEQFEDYKRIVSFRYLEKIRNFNTWGILVFNLKKHNINDYIGPNTFAEIAVSFSNRKKVYLMFGMPCVYEDELRAWRACSLNGQIERLVDDYRKAIRLEDQQYSLFMDI